MVNNKEFVTAKYKHNMWSYIRQHHLFISALSLMIIGASLVILSQAATNVSSLQPELGTPKGTVTELPSSNASGGYYVRFNKPVTNCVYTQPTAADKWGGMTYVNYTFNQPDIYEVSHEFDVLNNPSETSNFYIQLYDSNIGARGQYFGVQTTGLVIWSQWNVTDKSNIRPAAGSTSLGSVELGADYISLRRDFGSLPTGHYKTRIVRAEYDGVGDWFKYYVTFPGLAEQHIGDMRYARKTSTVKASFNDGGGQWNEFWDNNGPTLKPVPLLKLNMKMTVNSGKEAVHAVGNYQKMPNSDMYAISPPGGYVHHDIGATTARCHFPDSQGNLILW